MLPGLPAEACLGARRPKLRRLSRCAARCAALCPPQKHGAALEEVVASTRRSAGELRASAEAALEDASRDIQASNKRARKMPNLAKVLAPYL